MAAKIHTLIVEDDEGLRSSLEQSFRRRGHEVHGASLVSEARRRLGERRMDLVLLDIRLPDGSGFDVLAHARELDEEVSVVIMTAFPEVKAAVRAMREGARDFVVKPFELEELHLTVERALEARELRRRVRRLERERGHRDPITEIIGESRVVRALREQIRKVAEADSPVLVVGETGTGKELVADSIHRLSSRCKRPWIKVNCSSFSEHLLESELFGHVKGAFTGAQQARPGLFEMADGGSLLLDEIAELRPELQSKLLRVTEGHPFRRVGGTREISTDVRMIVATNRSILDLVKSGDFREDLYFRLNVFEITVPPLRSRGDDVVMLAESFLRRSGSALRKGELRLTPDAEALLTTYRWPGNVRELRNLMERATILCEGGEVGVEHLPQNLQVAAFVRRHAGCSSENQPSLAQIESGYVTQVLESVDGNLSEAARILGIARNTLKARLRAQGET